MKKVIFIPKKKLKRKRELLNEKRFSQHYLQYYIKVQDFLQGLLFFFKYIFLSFWIHLKISLFSAFYKFP
ncbi:MAG: hypothetical protein CEE43_06050 [Promethearchaeota archaeon Loki_b32]|nr:MAG: hypothetical protein CEE43_06050 [Candidatus Lokiarchaeota archaeon Loki_b32]